MTSAFRHTLLTVALALGVTGVAPLPAEALPAGRCAATSANPEAVRQMVAQVNAQRKSQGLSQLQSSPRLAAVAQSHSCDMAAQGKYTHVGSDGSDLRTRLRRGGYAFRLGAENTARGFDTTGQVVNFWMNSSYHRANILQPTATQLGVGLVQGDRPYWVLLLAAPR